MPPRIAIPHPAPPPNNPVAPPHAAGRGQQTATAAPSTPREVNDKHTPKKRANIVIATLNMNGATAQAQKLNHKDKWAKVNAAMRDNKIAILAVQETHLDEELLSDIKCCFGKSLDIFNSQKENNPRRSAGVAIVLNKALIAPTSVKMFTLQKGRAQMMRIKWAEDQEIAIINIYAPNNRRQHTTFWEQIDAERHRRRLPKPDFVVGDFNITEDPIDRSPPQENDETAIVALREMRQTWGIQDQWRHDNPSGRSFSHKHTNNGKPEYARLDRIYSARRHANNLFEWESGPSAVPSDHWLVSVKFAPKDAPLIGKGRWTWPIQAINHEPLLNSLTQKGIQAQEEIERLAGTNPEDRNTSPQIIWRDLKSDFRKTAKKDFRDENYRVHSKIKSITNDIKRISNSNNIDEDEQIREEMALLTSELAHLQKVKTKDQQDKTRAMILHQGEKPGGIWTAINKEKKPRDLIPRLKIPNTEPRRYERSSPKMADMARSYHEKLQEDGIEEGNDPDRQAQIERTLSHIPNSQKLEEPERTQLAQKVTSAQVEKALKLSKNGSATGLDGCPYELWKALNEKHVQDSKANKPSFDIIKTLTLVYNDIQINGVHEEAEFSQGWMCPIFKKKDRSEIENYRPITLLNTDYKLLSKVMALQLIEEINKLVHADQSGFIPRRSIFNNIRTATTLINYADITETDGAIIALDQEKAYDKIRHDYLWATLKEFRIPDTFIKTAKELYNHATTRVAINGILSNPFNVTRGVRQGDPLSCVLFNLAIEPLANRIRNDANIQGLKIPGIEEKVIISLYADDTSLFLSKDDNLDHVHHVLSEWCGWCQASGARFNQEKTEILPIGTREHRRRVVATRKLNENEAAPLNNKIRITEDGEAIRLLGAWIGNDTNATTPWEPVLDKINKALKRYSRSHPTLAGRKTIAQFVIGGHTQFLTQAQGMPSHIEKAITKILRDFIWEENASPRIALEYLFHPVEKGGLGLIDIQARNEAIEIVWLKNYLNLSPTRPTWAKITDIILDAAAPPGYNAQARINTFLQTWNVPTRGIRADRLSRDIQRMLKTAKTYNANFEALRLGPNIKKQLPAWFQIGAVHRPINNKAARCLLNKHQATTIADLMRTSARIRGAPETQQHRGTNFCNCPACAADNRKGCTHPHDCAVEALARITLTTPKANPLLPGDGHGNLSLTRRRKEHNQKAKDEEGSITFDPTMTCKNDLAECFRIFTDPQRSSKVPAQRLRRDGADRRNDTVRIHIAGACENSGKSDAKCGGGIWYSHNDPRNESINIHGGNQSSQIGEITALIKTLETTPHFQPLEIITDSKYIIEGLTEHLSKWEDRGWIKIQNAELLKKTAYLLKRRSTKTTFTWRTKRNEAPGNQECKELAKEGTRQEGADPTDVRIPEEFDLQGAKLASIDQATAYHGILTRRTNQERPDARENLNKMRHAIEETNGTKETDATIWKSIRKPILRPRVQQFIYKTMHNAYMIGEKWNNIPKYRRRGICRKCKVTESMEHILLHCKSKARKIIWKKARKLWPHDQQQWPNINLGTILGVGSIKITKDSQEGDAISPIEAMGRTRLLQLLIAEASHLIWVIRCEKTIQKRKHTRREIKARWYKAINSRMTSDRIIATKISKVRSHEQLIDETWKAAREKAGVQHQDWLNNREVFSG